MPRRVQDIKSTGNRTVRSTPASGLSDIKVPQKTKPAIFEPPIRKPLNHVTKEQPPKEHPVQLNRVLISPPPEEPKRKKPGRRKFWLILGIIIVVVLFCGAGFVASARFARATFVITPVSKLVTVNGTFVADNKPDDNDLLYLVTDYTTSASTTVAAADGPSVSLKAQGNVTVYNAYSSVSVRLVAGTRVAGDSGLVYRLTGSIVIPGYTKSSSGTVIPGTTAATIVADQPGEDYNIPASGSVSDLKIVAYKGTSKYNVIYVRLASAVTGGFVGIKKAVSQEALASTTATMESALTASLLARAKNFTSSDYILYDDSYVAGFSQPVVTGVDSKTAVISVTGTLHAITFNRNMLVTKLAGNDIIGSFGSFSFRPIGLDNLSFTLTDPNDFSTDGKKTLVVKLKGQFTMVGLPPTDILKKKLAGIPLSETGAILRSYAPIIDIANSYGEITPSWIASVPLDLSRISIVVKSAN